MHLQSLVIKAGFSFAGCMLAACALANPEESSDRRSEKLPTLQQVMQDIELSRAVGQRNTVPGAGQSTSEVTTRPDTDSGLTQAHTVPAVTTPVIVRNTASGQGTSNLPASRHSLETLANGAGDFARREHKSAERVDVALTPIDRRLILKRCDTEPVYSWTSETNTMGNTSITAACMGTAPWKVLVRAQVRVYQQIPVLVAPVNKGDVLLAEMVSPRLMDVSALRRETIRSIDKLVGYQFKRRLAAGREITSSILVAPRVVSKGDLVLISASNSVLDVQMKGIALGGGTVGKKINVRSNSSGRVIQTWIKGPGQVEVTP